LVVLTRKAVPKSFEFRDYENTDSKFRLSVNWRNEKLEYDFRIERLGNFFPGDIEGTFLSPHMVGLELTWAIKLVSSGNSFSKKKDLAILYLRQFQQALDAEGRTLAFDASGALACPRNFIDEIEDWTTSGPTYVMGSIGRDSLILH
jgi:hypothetical protein